LKPLLGKRGWGVVKKKGKRGWEVVREKCKGNCERKVGKL
jgi:hypothetical protein